MYVSVYSTRIHLCVHECALCTHARVYFCVNHRVVQSNRLFNKLIVSLIMIGEKINQK